MLDRLIADGKSIPREPLYSLLKPTTQVLDNLNLPIGSLYREVVSTMNTDDVLKEVLGKEVPVANSKPTDLATKLEKVIDIWKEKMKATFSNDRLIMSLNAKLLLQRLRVQHPQIPQTSYTSKKLAQNKDVGRAFLFHHSKAMEKFAFKATELIGEILIADAMILAQEEVNGSDGASYGSDGYIVEDGEAGSDGEASVLDGAGVPVVDDHIAAGVQVAQDDGEASVLDGAGVPVVDDHIAAGVQVAQDAAVYDH